MTDNPSHLSAIQSYTNGDTAAFESLMAEELKRLTVKERSGIEEEIHGVNWLAPQESHAMIESKLKRMQQAIERLPEKNSYDQAVNTYQERQRRNLSLLASTVPAPTCYVMDPELRIRFLRCELWDPMKAAKRFVKYLDMVLEHFGPMALERRVSFSDLCRESKQIIRRGNWQVLPSRDSAGRILLCHQGWISLPTPEVRIRIILYMMMQVSEDYESQNQGCVLVFTADESSKDNLNQTHIIPHLDAAAGYPIRLSAVHLCLPNTPFSRILKAGILLSMTTEQRYRVRICFDDLHSSETQSHLKTFGIPTLDIPCTSSGVIKSKYHLQWLKARAALDDLKETGFAFHVVVHPGKHDVLFSQGGGKVRHTGNLYFREVLEKYLEKYQSAGKDWNVMKTVRNNVITEIKDLGGRFLTFDKELNWWTDVASAVDLDDRITSSFYHHGKRLSVAQKSQQSQSSSPVSLQGSKRRKHK